MGTRSRIILRRTSKPHIHLWMHWDGYLSGQGDRICEQLRILLSKYSSATLQAMLDTMGVEDAVDYQNFSAEFLSDFLEGHVSYKNDECDDIEYEYTIDFTKGLLLVECHGEKTFVVLFGSIQDGFNVSQLTDYFRT